MEGNKKLNLKAVTMTDYVPRWFEIAQYHDKKRYILQPLL